jgi:hypothetical protein
LRTAQDLGYSFLPPSKAEEPERLADGGDQIRHGRQLQGWLIGAERITHNAKKARTEVFTILIA